MILKLDCKYTALQENVQPVRGVKKHG